MEYKTEMRLAPKPSLVSYLKNTGTDLAEDQKKVAAWIDGQDDSTISAVIAMIEIVGKGEKQLFIPLKEAGRRLNMCTPKLQGYARSHYKGCPAIMEGNKYLFNVRMLPGWADQITQDAIEGRL